MIKEDKIPGSNIIKVGNKWRVVSGKTGKLWPAHYDTREDAEAGLRGYFANESLKNILKPIIESYLKEYIADDGTECMDINGTEVRIRDGKVKIPCSVCGRMTSLNIPVSKLNTPEGNNFVKLGSTILKCKNCAV